MSATITLEQWLTFKTIVDEGSFAQAAESLNKSQSSISYTMARLNDQLPAPLLVQEGRKAVLTDAGKVMYRQASRLLEQAESLEKTMAYIAKGWEEEVVIALDALTLTSDIFCALHDFSMESQITRVRVLETTLSGTDEAILTRQAHLAVTARIPPGFLAEPLHDVKMIAVANPAHPLFNQRQPITEIELKHHRQIVLRDSGVKRQQNAGWLGSEQRWTVSHFSSSIEAVKAGLGFAFIPENKIQEELRNGELRKLELLPPYERKISLYLVLVDQHNAGPAAKAVAKHIARKLKN